MKTESGLSFWKQPGKIEELTRLWASDAQAETIAKLIGAPSRNSVIGKAFRLGLPMRGPRRVGTGALRGAPSGKAKPPKRPWIDDELSADRQSPFAPLEGSKPVPFLERKSSGCSWPIDVDGGGYFCCGRKKDDEHPSYCRAHRLLGVQAVVRRTISEPLARAA